ncbi:MAG: hypothetical protein R2738_00765 [Bacteroides graminisolvens]
MISTAQDLSSLPAPDAVFIGGHGGKLKEMMEQISRVLLPGGIVVFNSVSENSYRLFLEAVAQSPHWIFTNGVPRCTR